MHHSDAALTDLRAFVRCLPRVAELATTIDDLFRVVAQTLGETIGDASLVNMLTDDRAFIRPTASYHADESLMRDYRAMLAASPAMAGEGQAGAVIATGKTLFVPVCDPVQMAAAARADWRTVIQGLSVCSVIIAPIFVLGRSVGAISAFRSRPASSYTDAHVAAVEELATTVGRLLEKPRRLSDATIFSATPAATTSGSSPWSSGNWSVLGYLFDTMPQLGFSARADGFIDYYNQRWYDYTGKSYEELAGWGWQTVHDPAMLPQVLALSQRCIANQEPFELTFPLRSKGGQFRWFLTRVTPLFDEQGTLVRWVGINTDVDDLRREREARQLLDRISSATTSLDYAATLEHVVAAALPTFADFCTVYALGRDQSLGQVAARHADARGNDLLAAIQAHAALDPELSYGYPEVVRTGKTQLIERVDERFLAGAARNPEHLRLMQQLGATSLLIAPLQVGATTFGAIAFGMTTAGRAFTKEDVPLAQELARRAGMVIEHARLYRDAQQASRAKDEFLAILGHELRNPLSPLITGLQIIRMKAPGFLQKEVDTLERQTKHMTRLVDDLLDVSRIASGKINLAEERVQLGELLKQALETLDPVIQRAQHEVHVHVGEQAVKGDRVRLLQIFSNLIANAAKYTPARGIITLRSDTDGDFVEISVQDNGTGIDAQLLPQVFDLFVQARQNLARSAGGLGLGLAIVKSLAEAHGGSVRAHSAGLGQGSTFTVRLPRASDSSPRPAPVRVATPSQEQGKRRVLVVDDHRDGAAMIAEAMSLCGYDVTLAYDGQHAVQLAQTQVFDAALVDIGLPIMNGYEVAQQLRAVWGADALLVAFTGYGQDSDRQRALAAGFDAHLTKPVDFTQLRRLLVADRLGSSLPKDD